MARNPPKGRRPWDQLGEDCPHSKLTEEEVYEIRASNMSKRALARKYGVVHSTIIHIQQRKIWSHLP